MNEIEPSEQTRLTHLLLWRGLAMMLVLIAVWFYFPSMDTKQQDLLAYVGLLFVVFAVLQMLCLQTHWRIAVQLFFQFFSDVVLVGLLVVATDGYHSPFVLLFGLVIVAAGTQAQVLLVLSIAVAACASYLTAIYSFVWWQDTPLPTDATLKLLMQTSVLMLVGGVMALIARRHALLSQDHRKAKQEHKALQALHTRLMASMQEGVVVLDEKFRIRDSNPAAWDILHIDDGLELDLHEVWTIPQAILSFFANPFPDSFRCEWKRDGKEYLVTVGRFSEKHVDAYWWLTFVDVTELRLLERKFAEHEKLAAMGRMAAMLAHELRNPMQTIAQAIDLVPHVKAAQQHDIQRIVGEEVSRLNRLVADMLDYTKPLNPSPKLTFTQPLIEASIQQIDAEDIYGIETKCDIQALYIDADHMRLVLDNLIRNAVLASPEQASVCVAVFADDVKWSIEVRDTGEGFPSGLEHQIFEPFATHRAGGTGLGLATVWQVCQANQWHIQVDRKDDMTIFRVSGEDQEQMYHG